MMNLKGKLALITGASGGIGQAVAYKLAACGANLCLHGFKNMNKIEVLTKELKESYPDQNFSFFSLDLSRPAAGVELVHTAGRIHQVPDILVLNAGKAHVAMVNDLTLEEYTALQRIHLETPIFAAQAVFPHMLHKKWGRIVTISSIWGLTGASCEVAYSAVKAGLIGMTKALAKEWGPSGITVNCVAPGVIATEMNKDIQDDVLAELIAETPVGRLGRPEDIAEAVAFFVQPSSDFTTGQVLSPNGGMVL